MIDKNSISGNETDSPDLLKVLLALKENIMKDIGVCEIGKVTDISNNKFVVVPIGNNKQKLYCDKLKSVSAEKGDIVLVCFTDTDNRLNLKNLESEDFKNIPSKTLHSNEYGVICGSFSKEGGSGSAITVIDDLRSTSAIDALSANQGRVLDNKITNLQSDIPEVINNTQSSSQTDALSANMGKELQDQINNLKARGRFLALWNAKTGLAQSSPTVLPYEYKTGDYFIVGTVDTLNENEERNLVNYRPSGTQYTGVASTTIETEVLSVDDVYYYDGTTWRLQINRRPQIGFANITGQPTDNSNLASALNTKADKTGSVYSLADMGNRNATLGIRWAGAWVTTDAGGIPVYQSSGNLEPMQWSTAANKLGVPTSAQITNWNNKQDGFGISQYIGTAGNPRPTKFMSINYSNATSENSPMIKVSIVGGHGNAQSYLFLEDVFITVSYLGNISVNNYQYYAADTTYDGGSRKFGHIFYVHDTGNKVVDFYLLAGQYSYIRMTPAFRLTPATAGTITQPTTSTIYSTGTKVWANNAQYSFEGGTAGYIPLAGTNQISGNLEWAAGQTDKWLIPYLLAFKNADTSQSPTYPYTGFYQWGPEWQVNARDANNVFVHNLLTINNQTKVANFTARPTLNGQPLALLSEISGGGQLAFTYVFYSGGTISTGSHNYSTPAPSNTIAYLIGCGIYDGSTGVEWQFVPTEQASSQGILFELSGTNNSYNMTCKLSSTAINVTSRNGFNSNSRIYIYAVTQG